MHLHVHLSHEPPPAEEANNSDWRQQQCRIRMDTHSYPFGYDSSADDARPQYFIRNSDSSATTAAKEAATTAASTAAAQEQTRPFFYLPRPCYNERDKEEEIETRKLNGECSVVEGPSGVSTGRQKPRSVAP